ncbi:MAG: aldehyde ferredoxin oxidoreductase family protein, partial [Pseudomonadota bacterium]
LTTRGVTTREIEPLFAEKYLGGMGFSCRILYDEVKPETDPLGPENIVIFANGPLTGTSTPCSGRTEITTKSPLTGHIGTGNTGGLWGARLKRAGFDLVIVRGRSQKPVYVWIDDQVVEIRDADHLWGKDTKETTVVLKKEVAPSRPSKVSVLAIGQAGENLVRYACPVNDLHHVAARSGAGSVMGSKKLKAIAVRGTGSVPIAKPREFQEAVTEARERLMEADRASRVPGAPPDIRIKDLKEGCLPAKNFQTGVLPQWAETRSAAVAQKYVAGKEGTCHRCPISCFNLVEVNEGKYAGTRVGRGTMPGVVFNFGGMCAIDNLPAIWKCKELCQRFGLDYESTGASIAFAMELYQRGILTEQNTDGLELPWGNEDAALLLIEKIAYRDGFGGLLADGTLKAAEKIGGGAEKYALTVKGMEMAMMPDPRAGARIGWISGLLTNPRGGDNVKNTHFYAEKYNPNWWVDQFDMFEDVKKTVYGMPPEEISRTWQGKAMMCRWFEDLYSLCNALGFCFFTTGSKLAWGPSTMSRLYSTCTGRDTTPEEMIRLGERILTTFKAFTIREGFSRKDDTLPAKFFEEPLPDGPAKGRVLSREDIEAFLDEYYELRGWDKKTGLPTAEKLDSLGLSDIGADLKSRGRLPGS